MLAKICGADEVPRRISAGRRARGRIVQISLSMRCARRYMVRRFNAGGAACAGSAPERSATALSGPALPCWRACNHQGPGSLRAPRLLSELVHDSVIGGGQAPQVREVGERLLGAAAELLGKRRNLYGGRGCMGFPARGWARARCKRRGSTRTEDAHRPRPRPRCEREELDDARRVWGGEPAFQVNRPPTVFTTLLGICRWLFFRNNGVQSAHALLLVLVLPLPLVPLLIRVGRERRERAAVGAGWGGLGNLIRCSLGVAKMCLVTRQLQTLVRELRLGALPWRSCTSLRCYCWVCSARASGTR
ncbi:hypothetical protein B0H19DRAFT_108244 [Mycena capillaripes]|nr:hypothetical protein B0H19DRAFT_108244 [Mycena capillaripes]